MDFEAYVAARGDSLLRLAYVLTRDRHAAEDLTQAALADVLRRWGRVGESDHPDAYVRKAMLNRHLSWRRRRLTTEVSTADLDPLVTAFGPDPGTGVAARDEVRRALAMLAPRARAVLVLRYYADLDDNSIAEAMGITPSAVRATASRALAALRPHVADAEARETR